MNFPCQGLRKLSSDIQTDKHDQHYIPHTLQAVNEKGLCLFWTGFLLLCRIHFPWLFQTNWI